jgi:hypothetical protein
MWLYNRNFQILIGVILLLIFFVILGYVIANNNNNGGGDHHHNHDCDESSSSQDCVQSTIDTGDCVTISKDSDFKSMSSEKCKKPRHHKKK